jgi:RNA exonuclease 4
MLTLAQNFHQVREKVRDFLKDRILVGHSVNKDLAVLDLSHPPNATRDTSFYEPFRTKYAAGLSPALKKVVEGELDVNIQGGQHDSVNLILKIDLIQVEDAQATMALYRKVQNDFDRTIRMGQNSGPPRVEIVNKGKVPYARSLL